MAEEPNQDPQGQSNQQAPSTPVVDEKATEQPKAEVTQEELPEKFKDKSAAEIAKSYLELEKTIGKHTSDASKREKELEQWRQFGTFIEQNPQLYKQIEAEAQKLRGENRDTTVNDPASTQRDDTRRATENMVIGSFEQNFGIDKLPEDKRMEMHQKIGGELAELLDPSGNTPVRDIMNKIPLDKLPKYLEKAYKLATIGDENEKSRLQGIIDARQNNEATFNGMPSSSTRNNTATLTEAERAVAKRMKISDEEYLKNKLAIASEDSN